MTTSITTEMNDQERKAMFDAADRVHRAFGAGAHVRRLPIEGGYTYQVVRVKRLPVWTIFNPPRVDGVTMLCESVDVIGVGSSWIGAIKDAKTKR